MLILVSLPYEKDLNLDLEIEIINKEHNFEARLIDIPIFSGVSLENIIKYEEMIEKMNFNVIDLYKKFIKRKSSKESGDNKDDINKDDINKDDINKNDGNKDDDNKDNINLISLKWTKHNCKTIDTCLCLISEDIEKIISQYFEKESQHFKSLKEYEEAQRRTKGSLLEMDLSVILGERPEFEFIKEIFVLVDVEEINKFKKIIEDTNCVSEEAIEIIVSDDKHILYKAVVTRNMENDLKRTLKENFILKEKNTKKDEKTLQEKIKHHEESKDDLQIFVDSHKKEVLNLLIHTSLLKLFIESIYRYGLPIKYLYFGLKETSNVMKKLRAVGDNWESERMVGDDEYSGQDDQELNIAMVFIGFEE